MTCARARAGSARSRCRSACVAASCVGWYLGSAPALKCCTNARRKRRQRGPYGMKIRLEPCPVLAVVKLSEGLGTWDTARDGEDGMERGDGGGVQFGEGRLGAAGRRGGVLVEEL